MIYQEMYGYLTIEDPRERDKVWQSLSPQVKDYLNVFFNMLGDIDNPPYYENSKFYRLITKEEFESLIKVFYSTQQSQADVIDAAFEEEFKQAIIAYEKKSAMKAKMNQWRVELENEVAPASISNREQESVFYSRQQKMMEQDVATNQMPPRRYQNSLNDTGVSKGGCLLISVIAGILITIVLYFFFK